MSVFSPGNSSSTAASPPGILVEVMYEKEGTCSMDEYSFKGLAAQWVGNTVQVAPFTANVITRSLQKSASGAAASCSQCCNGTTCGSNCTTARTEGKTGFGQQLGALNVILATLQPTLQRRSQPIPPQQARTRPVLQAARLPPC